MKVTVNISYCLFLTTKYKKINVSCEMSCDMVTGQSGEEKYMMSLNGGPVNMIMMRGTASSPPT